ncbi:MAG: TetR/AcrR family transcriptional regulator [Elusimicrobiota bacterium]
MPAAPSTPKGQKTRERIITISGEVFSKTGYGLTGVADICAASDIAVGGFYRYFSGKEEVLAAVVASLEARLSAEVAGLPPAADLRSEIAAVAGLYFRFVAENKDFYQVMREAEFACERVSKKFYGSFASAILARLAGCGAGKDEAAVYALIGILSFVGVKNLLWQKRPVPAGAAAAAAEVFLNGVSRGAPDFAALVKKAAALKKAPQPKAAKNTAARLLASAEVVFGRLGYGPAHISEITKHAGYAAGTFYTCFKSKKEALDQLVIKLRNELVAKAAAYSKGSASRTETEVLAFIALFDFIAEHPCGYSIMREAEFVDFKLAEDYYIYILNGYTAGMRAYARPGEFALNDHETLSLMMMGMGHMLGLKYALWSAKNPGSKEIENLLRRVFSGFNKTKK